MNRKALCMAGSVSLLLVLACAAPAIGLPPPIPTTDPNRLSTMVAGTASVLMSQTAQGWEMLAVETPVAPSETPYATPSRPASGSALQVQPDGSTYFADAVTGLEMVIPPGWMALRIGEQEYYRAWADETAQRLGFTHILTNFSNQDPNIIRLIALDTQDEHSQNLFTPNILVQTGYSRTTDETVQSQLEYYRAAFTELEVFTQQAGEISPGVQAITLEIAYNGVSVSTGEEVRIYEKLVVFAANGQVTSIKLETPEAARALTLPQFDQLLAGLVFYTP